MPRLAQIEDGKIKNLVDVPHHFDHTQHEALADHVPVPDGIHVQIGYHFDAPSGTFRTSGTPKEELIWHAMRRYREQIFAAHKLASGQIVSVDSDHRQLLVRLAERARANPQFTIPWPMYREQQAPVVLNAAQIIELNDRVTDWEIASMHAYKGVMDAIESGAITGHDGVDSPPHPAAKWPQRFRLSGARG
jgi:hypothetical protein